MPRDRPFSPDLLAALKRCVERQARRTVLEWECGRCHEHVEGARPEDGLCGRCAEHVRALTPDLGDRELGLVDWRKVAELAEDLARPEPAEREESEVAPAGAPEGEAEPVEARAEAEPEEGRARPELSAEPAKEQIVSTRTSGMQHLSLNWVCDCGWKNTWPPSIAKHKATCDGTGQKRPEAGYPRTCACGKILAGRESESGHWRWCKKPAEVKTMELAEFAVATTIALPAAAPAGHAAAEARSSDEETACDRTAKAASPVSAAAAIVFPAPSRFELIAAEVGKLVTAKNIAYGDSYARSGDVMRILFPAGIHVEKVHDALAIVRVVDKLFRIATAKDAFGESPWRDIAGYGVLGAARDEEAAELARKVGVT